MTQRAARAAWHRLAIIASGLLIVAAPVRSQAPPPLPIDVLLNASVLSPFSEPTITPDGSLIAYTVVDRKRAGGLDEAREYLTAIPWSAVGADIWVSDLTGTNKRNLTQSVGNNWLPSWSPDGQRLAFISDRESTGEPAGGRLWIWDRTTDTFTAVGDVALVRNQGDLAWSLDGRKIALRVRPEGMSESEYMERVARPASAEDTAETGDVTAKVYSFDPSLEDAAPETNAASPDVVLADLALIDVATGAVQRVSRGQRIVFHAFSPDGKRLAWITMAGYERAGSLQVLKGISVYDLDAGESRELVNDAPLLGIFADSRFSWSPSSDVIAYQAAGPGGGAKDAAYIVSLDGPDPTVRQIAEGLLEESMGRDGHLFWTASGEHLLFGRRGEIWRAAADGSGAQRFASMPNKQLRTIEMGSGQVWSPDGRHGVVSTFDTESKRTGLASVELASGSVEVLFEEEKRHGGYDNAAVVTPDGKSIVFAAEDASHPAELWLARGEKGAVPRQISQVAPDLARFELGRTGLIEWRSLDGDTLRGAVIYPVGYEPGKRYPMIVKVYGGVDVSNDLFRFGFAAAPVDNLQLFASRGYVVLYTDSRLNVGTPMFDLLKSVLPGVDKAVELGFADPDRIGIMGHSYGGYSTLSLIAQTTRFKAAMASAGMADLVAAYGSLRPDGTNYLMSWAEAGQGRMGGTIWEYRDRYIENSPIYYLDHVTTPLLIINGSEDIAPTLADQVFSSLRRLGKRVEYARYAGEEHWPGSWTFANQKDYLQRTIAWFDQYLNGQTSGPDNLSLDAKR